MFEWTNERMSGWIEGRMTERIEPTRKSEAQILLFRLAMYGREEIEITAPWQTDREINYICARCRRFHGNRSSVFCYRLRSFTWCGVRVYRASAFSANAPGYYLHPVICRVKYIAAIIWIVIRYNAVCNLRICEIERTGKESASRGDFNRPHFSPLSVSSPFFSFTGALWLTYSRFGVFCFKITLYLTNDHGISVLIILKI